ncbi:MAG: glutamate-5-semialdehyde dehydrogenase [Oscillospiraceae bacterium]|nr:glutamate-5-semialdehyde dehydrogenase [Oscillospiraceae bacterium]MCI7498784.1 glutamate-5-semialdehyde dehydrogenase [Oscillospiraceae bacterium]MDY2864779.1 glutamate-5-semialdehyde dehydrogenase [Oscillospiraceae bacterium]
MTYIETLGANAAAAKKSLISADTEKKNAALQKIAEALLAHSSEIIEANAADLKAARENGMSVSMQDRLMLNEDRIKGISDAVSELIKLEDPIGRVDNGSVRPNGLRITKVRVPMGVIGMIYESRPNVTADAATLCLKTGNAVILRGGKEAYNSNKCICNIMRDAVEEAGFPKDIIQFVDDTTREVTTELMKCNKYLDLLIPRGGAGLIRAVTQNATVPVIETGTGNCHIYIDKSADIEMGVNITDNGKTQRPSVCNALETLLVHKDIAEKFLPAVKAKLDEHNVELRGCPETVRILGDCVTPATDDDYATEFGDYIMAVKVVNDIDEAIEHIEKYSTGHSECIVTNDLKNAEKFKQEVDSACVYVNASTRFTDGGMFGFGAEIGISTQKLHARGPMGLYEITSNKYLIDGNGQIR